MDIRPGDLVELRSKTGIPSLSMYERPCFNPSYIWSLAANVPVLVISTMIGVKSSSYATSDWVLILSKDELGWTIGHHVLKVVNRR